MPAYTAIGRTVRKMVRRTRARRYDYKRLVHVRISRACLLHNYRVFQAEYAPVGIAPVLKSNAYGHGLVQAARIFAEVAPPFLVVESYHEALILRNEGLRVPVLVVGYTATENVLQSRLADVAFTIVDFAQLRALAQALTRPQRFHLKVDTGMRRYGISVAELGRALQIVGDSKHMLLEGACSHMAKTISTDDRVARAQIRIWNKVAAQVRQSFPEIPFLHLASTGGSFWSSLIDANVIRLGLGAYGYDNSPRRTLPLKPALSLVSTIGAVRHVAPGDGIGYGHSFTADRTMKVATVASGYYTGVPAQLSNCGAFTVQGIPCPIVGRVCMNGTIIDVSTVDEVDPGDEVTLISPSPEDPNAVSNIVQLAQTSHHVVLTGIPSRLRRIIH